MAAGLDQTEARSSAICRVQIANDIKSHLLKLLNDLPRQLWLSVRVGAHRLVLSLVLAEEMPQRVW